MPSELEDPTFFSLPVLEDMPPPCGPSPLVSRLSLPAALRVSAHHQCSSFCFSHHSTCTDLTDLVRECPKPCMACACQVSLHPPCRDSSSFTLHIKTGAASVVTHHSALAVFPLCPFSVFHSLARSLSFKMLIKYCLLQEAIKTAPTACCMSFSLSTRHMCARGPR